MAPRLPLFFASQKYEMLAQDETPSAKASAARKVRQVRFQEEELAVEEGRHSAKRRVMWQVCVGEGEHRRDVTIEAEKTPGGRRRVLINGGLIHEETDSPLSFGFELTEPNAFQVKEEDSGRIQFLVDNMPLDGWSTWTPKASGITQTEIDLSPVEPAVTTQPHVYGVSHLQAEVHTDVQRSMCI
jgi:hypothetical protein